MPAAPDALDRLDWQDTQLVRVVPPCSMLRTCVPCRIWRDVAARLVDLRLRKAMSRHDRWPLMAKVRRPWEDVGTSPKRARTTIEVGHEDRQ